MWLGAEGRVTLAVLPVLVLVAPARCSPRPPPRVRSVPAPSVATATQETRGERTPVAAITRPDMPEPAARPVARPDAPVEPAPPAIARKAPPAEPAPSAATAKQEAPAQRVTTAPRPEAPSNRVRLADEVVVRAIAVGQPLFLRCFARARRVDPTLDAS
ncbi:MAG TPA: hypothetical protein VFK02_00440, partial [Kofleriaceae bacterium]|nr:hypothetical protein [Kofleriaceae bacterium]